MNEGSLQKTYDNLIKMKFARNYQYEIIFINDGSRDNSLKELLTIREKDKNVKIINFTRNFGQVAAIEAGFEFATGDLLINISADLQDPTQLIEQMIDKWKEGFKVVACERTEREENLITKITSKIFYSLIKINLPKMPLGGFDYFLLEKEVYKQIVKLDERNSFLQGDVLWFGYEPYFIQYKRLKRPIGKSQWSLWKKIKYFIDGLIYTSYIPIRLMSLLGIIVSLVGFVYSIVVVILYFSNQTPFKGYAPIMMLLLIVSGLIMFMLGIIGEYLWRIYDEVRRRPLYIIKDMFI